MSTPSRSSQKGPFSRALMDALLKAARNPELLQELVDRRGEALAEWGIALSPTDRAMLSAVDEAQLRAVLRHLTDVELPDDAPAPAMSRGIQPDEPDSVLCTGSRPGDRPYQAATQGIRPDDIPRDAVRGVRPARVVLAAATTAAVLAGGASLCLVTHGARPDPPPASQPILTPDATRSVDAGAPDAKKAE